MKLGSSGRSSPMACQKFASPCSVLGGKNSNEKTGPPPAAYSSSMRISASEASPALRIGGDALCTPRDLEVLEVGQRLREPPVGVGGAHGLAVDERDDLERGALLAGDRLGHLGDALGD